MYIYMIYDITRSLGIPWWEIPFILFLCLSIQGSWARSRTSKVAKAPVPRPWIVSSRPCWDRRPAGSCLGRWQQGGCGGKENSWHDFPAEPSAEHFASIGFRHEPLCGQVQRRDGLSVALWTGAVCDLSWLQHVFSICSLQLCGAEKKQLQQRSLRHRTLLQPQLTLCPTQRMRLSLWMK